MQVATTFDFLKALTILALLSNPIIVKAQDVKLECQIRSKYTYPSGRAENNEGLAWVEIQINPNPQKKLTLISITSSIDVINNTSVWNYIENKSNDLSDNNKWDISSIFEQEKNYIKSRVVINRNTGRIIIIINSKTNELTADTYAEGNCIKINPNQKKF